MKKNSLSFSPVLIGVVICFILSGFAALLYQTAWMRQFSLVFGTSELAIAAVISAYMGGLSLGASIASRYVDRIRRPILFYGVLEAGIALSALAVPLLLQLARFFYVAMLGGQPEPVDASGLGQSFFYLIVAFIVLAIPTAFMGATLPLLTKYVVRSEDQIGARVGLLYATNTLGAIAGTLVAGFVLLPRLGLNGTVWVGAIINLIVFVLAALIAKRVGKTSLSSDREPEECETQEVTANEEDGGSVFLARYWILPIMLFSGANSFVYEVLWTRLLGHLLGGSIAAFATMLAGFLSGIAIGSAIASRFAKTRSQAAFCFVLVQLGIAATSALVYQLLPLVIPESAGLSGNILFAIMILLPATTFIGATFPLAVRMLAVSRADAAMSSAKVYSWNTVGAIVGATLAAFFVIPLLKYEGTIKLAVLLNVFLAFVAVFFLAKYLRAFLVSCLLSALIIFGFYHPKMPEDILRSSPVSPQPGGEIIFYEVGRSATVVVIRDKGRLYLRTNGLPEASSRLRGSPPERSSQQLLSVLPVLARPDAENMLVVGLGGGVALESIPKSVTSVDVIELEPEVVLANQFYGDQREIDPLKDPRVEIIINDARSALSLTNKKYDAIVSQPSHPWTAGASHLYSREYMSLVRDHLSDDGVFLQWMNAGFVDGFLLKSLSATMLDVFPHVRMYHMYPGVISFVGSNQPLELEKQMALTGKPLTDDVLTYLEHGIGATEDLIVGLAMDQENLEAFAQGAPVNTDNRNYMATTSARVSDDKTALNPLTFYELTKSYDPLTSNDSWIDQELSVTPNYSYIARRLDAMGMHQRAKDLAERLYKERNAQALIVTGLGLQQQGDQDESQILLREALSLDPNNQQARYALLQPWFESIFLGREVPGYIKEEVPKLEGSAADVFLGLQAMEVQDMESLLNLDAELAAVLPTDLWYSTSVKLRAEWRVQLTTPGYQPRMYNEATALLDSAIALFLDIQLYMMRIRTTYLAGDVSGSLVTTKSVLNLIDSHITRMEQGHQFVSERSLQVRALQLDSIENVLNGVVLDVRSAQPDVDAIRDTISGLRERILKISDE